MSITRTKRLPEFARALEQLTDPALREQIDLFNGQEAQHFKQHLRFNQAMRLRGLEKLKDLEAAFEGDYRRFTDTRSLRFNLAYAEGFEAFTTAMARYSLEGKVGDRLHPAVKDLFVWHLVEELEHRTVVFDVYERVFGGYFYRLFVGGFAQVHLLMFALRVAARMLGVDREGFRQKYGGWFRAFARLRPQLWLCARLLLPKVLATYLPWYTPHRIAMPEEARLLAQHYSERSLPDRN